MIAAFIRLVSGAQARWVGCAPEPRQRIYFANHSSNLDGPTIWASLPAAIRMRTRPIAARDYWDAGPLRRLLAKKILHAVLINRGKITAADNPLHAMEAALAEGSSLIIFPEGTRTLDDDGGMNPFKPGLWHLAHRHPQLELIPVYLENLNRILPKGEFLLVPILSAVTFGEAVALEEGEEKQAFLERARRAIENLSEKVGE
jgi:1-acyl-sn-glycerol-3-phosphate acyltransferase